jgi:hypothetical protein
MADQPPACNLGRAWQMPPLHGRGGIDSREAVVQAHRQ